MYTLLSYIDLWMLIIKDGIIIKVITEPKIYGHPWKIGDEYTFDKSVDTKIYEDKKLENVLERAYLEIL